MDRTAHPFWVMVNKEITDHVKSWRFIILIVLIAFTCLGSLYTALSNFGQAVKPNDPDGSFFFLKLFTLSDGTLPPFIIFISFLFIYYPLYYFCREISISISPANIIFYP